MGQTDDGDGGRPEWGKVSVRVPPELEEWLHNASSAAGISLSGLVRLVLIAAMRRAARGELEVPAA